ncbi:3-methyl-2-oxobutanoate hydroxymethyltransferase [Pseudomonas eucalypticola]|uniref:3-methyl-2-oxobutanoate hydroxymethyltransferase n=1 Tax=Pseudomonas eucalypticola TaxID=2599595 RepID=UPI001FD7D43D|nr:3-methyl-2-oxobutanoate hydroxymethyltransferase [Pseudomonas eucalypticola]
MHNFGLPSTVPVTIEQMIAHGAAVVRGAQRSLVIIDLPFGSYEASPEQAFHASARLLKETGAAAVKLEAGAELAETVSFLTKRGIPVMAHVGLTPQSVNTLGSYGARGRTPEEHHQIVADAQALADAQAVAIAVTQAVQCPVVGIGASAKCDGQVLVVDDMLGMFERTARFVKQFDLLGQRIDGVVAAYADGVRSRAFPGPENIYAPVDKRCE